MSGAGLAAFESWMDSFMRDHEGEIPGLAICIRDNSGVILNKAYGVHDESTGQKLQNDLLFPIASQSKTFTAVAVLKLAEQEKLNLDDQLVNFLPEFNCPELANVTIRDMLSHRTPYAGGFWPAKEGQRLPDVDTLRKKFNELNPVKNFKFAPEFVYSNPMYTLLGMIVAQVSGKPFEQFVQEEILDAHDLKDIYPGYNAMSEDMRVRIPKGYNHPDSCAYYRERFPEDSLAGNPACGFLATPEALTNFYHKLGAGQILSQAMTQEMFRRVNNSTGLAFLFFPPMKLFWN